MFSGTTPTLEQLKQNDLIPYALYYPSYLSLFRWTNELFYLINIEYYESSLTDSEIKNIYGYSFSNAINGWVLSCLLSILFRALAYLAIVYREQ